MPWNNHYKDEYQPRLSTKIYKLRHEGKLDEARQEAEKLIGAGKADYDLWQAYAWTLIDICKQCNQNGETETAIALADYLANLAKSEFEPKVAVDQFANRLVCTIRSLSLSVNPFFAKIQEAKACGKNGDNDGAWEILSQLAKEGHLPVEAHENYGWAIYRYMKDHNEEMTSEQVRGLLRDYMVLNNERPSLLHSQVLNFALSYSKRDEKFKLPAFLRLWELENLRFEDYRDSTGSEGKKIPSLLSRVARAVADYPQADIQSFISPFSQRNKFIELLKEHFFWKIYQSTKDGVTAETWTLFDQYLGYFPDAPASAAHSKVLGLAERVMIDNNAYRFYAFFKKWNPVKLMPEDWKEEKGENDVTYTPLAIKCIKKAKEALASLSDEQIGDLQWLIGLYGIAISKYPNDVWNIHSKALLHLKAGQREEAKTIYKDLCLKKGNEYYIWAEFADCWDDNDIKIALLCKAISLKNDDVFTGKIRLKLAQLLIAEGKTDNASVELQKYMAVYTKKQWHISDDVEALLAKCGTAGLGAADNDALYAEYIPKAEECAYADIPYTEVVLVDSWKNNERKEYLAFTDGHAVEFSVNKNRFPVLRKARIGQVWRIKLYKTEKYTPLIVEETEMEDWGSFPVGFGYVQHINEEKKVYHIYSTDSTLIYEHYERKSLNTGDFVTFRQYQRLVKGEKKSFFCAMKKCDVAVAMEKFKSGIAAVDNVNESKCLFHFVLGWNLSGILHYDQTSLRPSVGDCIKLYYFVRYAADKKHPGYQRTIVEVLKSEDTREVNGSLIREFSGKLELKYKGHKPFSLYEDIDDIYDEEEADFAFVGDYYVHQSLLRKYAIDSDCQVRGKAVYTGDGKWQVFEIEKI